MLLAGNQGSADEEPSIVSCLDISSFLPGFKSQLKGAVNLPIIDTYLDQFQLRGEYSNAAVFNFENLGQTLANMSDAIRWVENKPYADQALNKVSRGSSILLDTMAEVILSIDFVEVAQTLEYASLAARRYPITGSLAVDLVNLLTESINITRLGAAVKRSSESLSLQNLGSDLDAVKGNLDFEQLVGVLAGLPDAVDFYRVGQLLSGMAASFNFADVGLVVSRFFATAGYNLENCNST